MVRVLPSPAAAWGACGRWKGAVLGGAWSAGILARSGMLGDVRALVGRQDRVRLT